MANHGNVKTQYGDLYVWTCSCGAIQAMSLEANNLYRQSSQTFYCVHGHPRHYPQGPTEEDRLRKQVEEERRQRQRAEQQIEYEAQIRRQETERADHERNRANGYKGHATRITKRAKAGVCPCCNRTFKQLAQHMANKHPQFTPLALEDRPPEGATVQ